MHSLILSDGQLQDEEFSYVVPLVTILWRYTNTFIIIMSKITGNITTDQHNRRFNVKKVEFDNDKLITVFERCSKL